MYFPIQTNTSIAKQTQFNSKAISKRRKLFKFGAKGDFPFNNNIIYYFALFLSLATDENYIINQGPIQ